jgi:hypothetical protein
MEERIGGGGEDTADYSAALHEESADRPWRLGERRVTPGWTRFIRLLPVSAKRTAMTGPTLVGSPR